MHRTIETAVSLAVGSILLLASYRVNSWTPWGFGLFFLLTAGMEPLGDIFRRKPNE